jgi:hypothetical protein
MSKTLLSLALFAAFSAQAAVPQTPLFESPALSVAKHGADDPKGDDRGNHGKGHAKNGADDPKGDDRGNHGKGHAKNGADDPKGDDRGNHGKGHA